MSGVPQIEVFGLGFPHRSTKCLSLGFIFASVLTWYNKLIDKKVPSLHGR